MFVSPRGTSIQVHVHPLVDVGALIRSDGLQAGMPRSASVSVVRCPPQSQCGASWQVAQEPVHARSAVGLSWGEDAASCNRFREEGAPASRVRQCRWRCFGCFYLSNSISGVVLSTLCPRSRRRWSSRRLARLARSAAALLLLLVWASGTTEGTVESYRTLSYDFVEAAVHLQSSNGLGTETKGRGASTA